MTHGCVSSSHTLIYPFLPPLSQSIIFFLKNNNKKIKQNPELEPSLNWREEQCKQHMHEVYQALGWATMMLRKESKKHICQRQVKKKETKDLQIFQGRHKSAIRINVQDKISESFAIITYE